MSRGAARGRVALQRGIQAALLRKKTVRARNGEATFTMARVLDSHGGDTIGSPRFRSPDTFRYLDGPWPAFLECWNRSETSVEQALGLIQSGCDRLSWGAMGFKLHGDDRDACVRFYLHYADQRRIRPAATAQAQAITFAAFATLTEKIINSRWLAWESDSDLLAQALRFFSATENVPRSQPGRDNLRNFLSVVRQARPRDARIQSAWREAFSAFYHREP
ncbi:MAG: hypothetical protein A2682_03150 [Candidatus Terrybacteria bacterium RIFCSPHIGHO2_01_FULL_58_15]|uniref:Uncharacterized protein n=1 Tax=Terrybacteria sp. (strain RIFCSPHIGHO2_01_FULL_58_15) TaxID=1802363 RepID=A0A1G2PPX7_TERXR|nr:MAG: hypothetical protein A2682_03150 [Candidatus Terrybacteria bacterium RIFCSPHIGHO2_01_FULL_58_15]